MEMRVRWWALYRICSLSLPIVSVTEVFLSAGVSYFLVYECLGSVGILHMVSLFMNSCSISKYSMVFKLQYPYL
ncbi:hypothetical protein QBC43DRAFT_311260 [Cladorrhinum sp. PSN259]|nr:hypothetical protein QBC43DRAFT_311260 [Cladorrhinum sp. PSN259]